MRRCTISAEAIRWNQICWPPRAVMMPTPPDSLRCARDQLRPQPRSKRPSSQSSSSSMIAKSSALQHPLPFATIVSGGLR